MVKNKTLPDPATHSSLVSLSLTHQCHSSWRYPWILLGLDPGSKESACQCRRYRFDLCTRKIPMEKEMATCSIFLLGKIHRQKNLVSYSPQGHKESDTNEHNNNKGQATWALLSTVQTSHLCFLCSLPQPWYHRALLSEHHSLWTSFPSLHSRQFSLL